MVSCLYFFLQNFKHFGLQTNSQCVMGGDSDLPCQIHVAEKKFVVVMDIHKCDQLVWEQGMCLHPPFLVEEVEALKERKTGCTPVTEAREE